MTNSSLSAGPLRDRLRIGLLLNPVAGLGGGVALKGSDGADIQLQALARGGKANGFQRAVRFVSACMAAPLPAGAAQLQWFSWGEAMGAQVFSQVHGPAGPIPVHIVGVPATPSTAQDTRIAAIALERTGIDLLVFVGGDGTARDLHDVLGDRHLVLGVPAGVKMHSSVFATTPEAAAAVVRNLASGSIVSARRAEIRDLDEGRRRDGVIHSASYGEMLIPEAGGYVQHTKEGGRENETLALEEVAAQILEDAEGQLVLGPGSSCAYIKQALGLVPSLLGVDVWENGIQTGTDVDAAWLLAHARQPNAVILSFIRGQGFLLGRGNQQFSAQWLRQLPIDRLKIVTTRSKLATLDGRPLLIDTDSPELNERLCGLHRLLVGYEDEIWYRVATHS